MINNTDFMEQLNKYYTVWQECNYMYEEWAKAHDLSINALLVLEDKRNKRVQFTITGKEYADTIISKLRQVELFVIEEMGIDHMKQLNDNMALFVELFSKAVIRKE